MRDPSSWTHTAAAGWQYPVSRDWMVAAHTYDLMAVVNSGKGKKPKPYPHPWPDKEQTRVGRTNLPFSEVRAVLDRMNPKE